MLAVTCACDPLLCLSVLCSKYLWESVSRRLTGRGTYQCHHVVGLIEGVKHLVTAWYQSTALIHLDRAFVVFVL